MFIPEAKSILSCVGLVCVIGWIPRSWELGLSFICRTAFRNGLIIEKTVISLVDGLLRKSVDL
jgi:hypothetical protein